jgi:hypothetical protein
MSYKRQQDRLKLEKLFNVYFFGEPCRIADISRSGLGIVYLEGEDWPKNITLQYSLHWGISRHRQIQCRTVWESSMLFHTIDHEAIIRRRGLVFLEPESESIDILNRYLESIS